MATILVINDDPVQLHLLGSLLEQDYFEVIRFICLFLPFPPLMPGSMLKMF